MTMKYKKGDAGFSANVPFLFVFLKKLNMQGSYSVSVSL